MLIANRGAIQIGTTLNAAARDKERAGAVTYPGFAAESMLIARSKKMHRDEQETGC
jgi:hypothetical protein